MGFFRRSRLPGEAFPFNDGATQMGLNFLGQSGSGDYPFIDFMKTHQGWTYSDNSDQAIPTELNVNGWPVSGSGVWESKGGVYGRIITPSQTARPGNYVCRWTGSSTIQISTNNTLVSGSKVGGGGSNRYEFSTTSTGVHDIGITSGNVTDFTFCHEDDEAALIAGQTFGTEFLSKLRDCNIGVIRFLDWLHGNRTFVTDWASRKPLSHYSFGCPERRLSIWAGTTGGTGDNYTVASVPGAYQYGDNATYADKQYAIVKFDRNALTSTITFKLGTGPTKPVIRHNGDAITSGSRPQILKTAILMWDADLDSWLKVGGDLNDGYQYLMNYVPPEICFQLAQEIGAHPYYTLPYLAADPMTDWITELATYHRDNAPSWMIPRFEGVNELWHFSNTPEFPGTSYGGYKNAVRNKVSSGAQTITGVTFDFSGGTGDSGTSTITFSAAHPYQLGSTITPSGITGTNFFGYNGVNMQVTAIPTANSVTCNRASTSASAVYTSGGTAIGMSADNRGWYGRTIAELGQDVSAVYSDDRNRYWVICGVQTGGSVSGHDQCLKSSQYFVETSERAYDWVTHIATAQYWNAATTTIGGVPTIAEATLAFDYYITNAGNPSAQDANMVTFFATNTISALDTVYQAFNTWANSWGPSIGMTGYEGGYSPDYVSTNATSPITGATVDDGTHVTLTLATVALWGSSAISGNIAKVGMYLRITSVGGMTQLNSNTYQVSGVSSNSITIAVPDTTGFGAYTSGGSAEYYATTTVTMLSVVNTFRYQSRYHSRVAELTTDNMENFRDNASGLFPSHFLFSAKSTFTGDWVSSGQVWAIYDPDIYATPTAALAPIQAFTG
jgi:hypothetical protein